MEKFDDLEGLLRDGDDHSSKEFDLRRRAYQFSVALIKLLDSIETKRIHYSVIDQVIRSGTSVGANLVEAKSASSRRDFSKYYEIALKSANETKYWLGLLRDGLNIPATQIHPLLSEAHELANIIAASLLTLRDKRQSDSRNRKLLAFDLWF